MKQPMERRMKETTISNLNEFCLVVVVVCAKRDVQKKFKRGIITRGSRRRGDKEVGFAHVEVLRA